MPPWGRARSALGTLPQLAQALARGELSYSKVRALTRVATPDTEERLLRVGRAGTAEHVERIVRAWRYVDRKAGSRDAATRHATRTLYVFPDDDGMVVIRGRLEPEAGAVVMKALEAARETLYQRRRQADSRGDVPAGTPTSAIPEDMPTAGQLQADALGLLAETALHHGMDPGAAAERYQVVVHVDAAVLADADAPGQSVLDGGTRVPAETSQRLAAMRAASSCDTTPTAGSSRSAPERGRFGRRLLPAVPPPDPVPIDPVDDLRAQNAALAIRIDPYTAKPSWQGERLDVAYAIDVMHPLALASGIAR